MMWFVAGAAASNTVAKVGVGTASAVTAVGALAQVDVINPTNGLLEGGLAIAIAISFFSIVGALVTDKIVSSKASERIAREAAETAVREYIAAQKELNRG